jgi:phosphatidylglycerophosphate synthase
MTEIAGSEVRELSGFWARWIPWAMAAGRAALGPVLITAAACAWNPMALAGIVVTALLSDIFDGVLARRWGTDTAGVRLFDSMADTAFYLCTAVALWVAAPEVLRRNVALLGVLLALEAVRFGFDLVKFGKAASYHSYLAKTWGLVMAIAVTAVFAMGRGNGLVPVALGLGIACDLEGLAMSVMLPVWRRDVKWLGLAWRIRTAQAARLSPARGLASMIVLIVMLLAAAPAFAVSVGEAAYMGGTISGVAEGTLGALDTTAVERLTFRYKSPAAAMPSEIDMPYARILSFQYSTDVTHHIGVAPAIVVSLVKRRERKHFFTITYTDADMVKQVAIFEVPKNEPATLLAILRVRAGQACHNMPANYCGGNPKH